MDSDAVARLGRWRLILLFSVKAQRANTQKETTLVASGATSDSVLKSANLSDKTQKYTIEVVDRFESQRLAGHLKPLGFPVNGSGDMDQYDTNFILPNLQ